MTVTHRGHTITLFPAGRGMAYTVVRDADSYECMSGFSLDVSLKGPGAYLRWLQETIDDQLSRSDPWYERANREHEALDHTPDTPETQS